MGCRAASSNWPLASQLPAFSAVSAACLRPPSVLWIVRLWECLATILELIEAIETQRVTESGERRPGDVAPCMRNG